MKTGYAFLDAIIFLIVVALVFGLFTWLVDYVGVQAPFRKPLRALIGIATVVVLLNFILGYWGHSFIPLP